MFLPVNQAECSVILYRLIKWVETILEYSVKTLIQELDFDELAKLVEADLAGLLERRKIKKAIEELFELPYLERTEALWAFCNDVEFQGHIDDKNYQLHHRSARGSGSSAYMEVLNRLCNELYDAVNVKKGTVMTEIQKDGKKMKVPFNIRLLKEQYQRENGENGCVCPVCVRDNLFDLGEGQADHYFSRKKFPALAFHPFNLLPVCSDCNGALKGVKNPIDSVDVGPGELRTVFLPYVRPGKNEIEFGVSEDHERHIVMKRGPNGDSYTEKRIKNMERLFHLGKRWSRELGYVYDDLMAELNREGGRGSNSEERLAHLRRILRDHANSTKDRKDFVKGLYCAWLQTKTDSELLELFQNLTFVNRST